jgi:hypothetical protein
MVAAVVHRKPIEGNIAGAPANYISAKSPQDGPLKISAALPQTVVAPAAVSRPEEPTAVLGKGVPTATTAPAPPNPEDKLAVGVPIPSQPFAAPRPAAGVVAPQDAGEPIQAAVLPVPSPTGVAASSPTPAPAAKLSSAAGPPPVQLRLPAAEIAALLGRADRLFALGDISSARLFYERAADAGNARAALRLGNTFDPAFLNFAHLRVRGDTGKALYWYREARKLGETEVEILQENPEPVSSR